MSARVALLALACALLVDCAPAVSEILVRIYSDLPAGPELTTVRVFVRRAGAAEGVVREFALVRDGLSLPGELAVTASDPGDTRALLVRVVGEGAFGGFDDIRSESQVRFQPGAITVLNVVLFRRCAGVICEEGLTCGEARCESIVRGPLPEVDTPAAEEIGCRACDGRCVDTASDRANCGACGVRCEGEQQCVQGRCGCALGAVCRDACVDLESSTRNCGACGRVCPVACRQGVCVGVERVEAGDNNACAVMTDGTVQCWGANDRGQSGYGGGDTVRPVRLGFENPDSARLATREVSVGASHGCLIVRSSALCWGDGTTGALGDGRMQSSSNARAVQFTMPWDLERVAAGAGFSCATRDGSVWCWGRDDLGQRGVGPSSELPASPLRVPLPEGVAAREVAAGRGHACALDADGGVWCWGANAFGQTGGGGASPVAAPHRVDALPPARELSLGADHSCAIAGRSVYCWGSNEQGQVSSSLATRSERPVEITDFAAEHVAAGGAHTCALTPVGGLWCWGDNRSGQCQSASRLTRRPPARVTTFAEDTLQQITAGTAFTCASTVAHEAWCWGDNEHHQLGREGAGGPEAAVVGW